MAGQPDDRTNVATADRLVGYLTGWSFSPSLRITFRHILNRWFSHHRPPVYPLVPPVCASGFYLA
ncbi:hypothetical protein [Bacteroides sp. CAG:189]|uniref:hypothetical protein n=1 Tax=Bacteroides sp. CAG:189 TaxID=1262737 RepID=UPI00258D97A2|nr:hypothetical protein [Bacteroides sp. CAG:189]